MSTEIETLRQLKNNLLEFLDELIALFPNETDFVFFRIFVNDKIPIIDIMNYIIHNLCPLQQMVETRNEEFFLKHNILFEKLGEKGSTKINKFKTIWISNVLDKEDKETIWKWFATFIHIGNKYSKLNS